MIGVIVGADSNVEWLLPWWWENYCRYNSLPVAFADLGLSEEVANWCRARGAYYRVGDVPIHPKTNVLRWEEIYGPTFKKSRPHWFKKPLAILASPFKTGLWLDIDCEVCAPLNDIFAQLGSDSIGLVREKQTDFYNSGVILYRKPSLLLDAWEKLCRHHNDRFLGDQNALCELLDTKKYHFQELAPEYNWMMSQGINPAVIIAHWAGAWGKEHLQKYGGFYQIMNREAKPRG